MLTIDCVAFMLLVTQDIMHPRLHYGDTSNEEKEKAILSSNLHPYSSCESMIDNQLASRLNANKGRQEQGFHIIDVGRTENISNIAGTPPSHAEKWCQMLCATT
jgi:hypothetical protein